MGAAPITGYEGLYTVHDDGSVYSHRAGRFMKLKVGIGGYLRVTLCNAGRMRDFYVQRLVAAAFIPLDAGRPWVNHKDGNKKNNAVANLEWVTHSENQLHSWANLPRKPDARKKSVRIGNKEYPSMLAAAKAHGVLVGSIGWAPTCGKFRGMETYRV